MLFSVPWNEFCKQFDSTVFSWFKTVRDVHGVIKDNDSFTEGDICDASVIFHIKITFSSLSEEENNTATSFEFNGSI